MQVALAVVFVMSVIFAVRGYPSGYGALSKRSRLYRTAALGLLILLIIVAFVGRLHPAGMVLSAVLMSMFYIGGELAQSRLGLPKSITGVFQGLLLFCLLACDTLVAYRLRWVAKKMGSV